MSLTLSVRKCEPSERFFSVAVTSSTVPLGSVDMEGFFISMMSSTVILIGEPMVEEPIRDDVWGDSMRA